MPNPTMDCTKAKELKRLLRERAGKQRPRLDLSDPANKYTVWAENGAQGYGCFAMAADERALDRSVLVLGSGAAVLEANESGDRVTLWSCEVA